MKRLLAIVISVGLLLFGAIRVGVGSALLAQVLGFIAFDAFTEPLNDIATFLEAKNPSGLVSFTTTSYLGYILAMGVALTVGSIGSLMRRGWGLGLIGLYLLMHAALFANYQTINPKIVHLGVGIVLWLALIWLNRRPVR